jgi:hypothetical protein
VIIFAIILFTWFLYWYFLGWTKIVIYSENEVFSNRKTHGMAWFIIDNNRAQEIVSDMYEIKIPENDYGKNYLLISDGRQVSSVIYKRISKYQWCYDVPLGIARFKDGHSPNNVYIYKINKIMLKQDDD